MLMLLPPVRKYAATQNWSAQETDDTSISGKSKVVFGGLFHDWRLQWAK